MKISTNQKLKTGIFVTLGLGVLVLFVFLIGSQKNMFSPTFSVNGKFKNVSGLMVGSPVRFAGINVGIVDNIDIVNDTTVKVSLVLEKSVKKFIKTDSKISIGSDGLMGDKLVHISGGGEGDEVKHNQTLEVKNPMDMDKMMTRVDSIINNADRMVASVSNIMGKVDRGEGSLGRLLNENKLAKNLESTVANANNAVQKIGETVNAANNSVILRGYFKKKEKKKEKAREEAQEAAKKAVNN